jgi:uncharacterized protein YecE (DUF72 family)
MQLYTGTSGFSYKEWKGPFYPADLPAREMLRYYSAQLPAVEINNTFYRMPGPDMLQNWIEQVPAEFRFVLKAPRRITHTKPLIDKADESAYLCRTAATLGDRLGAILFQLPPYLRADAGLLAAFLEQLPPDIRAVFEFRHTSWFEDPIYELLHQKGSALCWADGDKPEHTCRIATADWGYLRLRRQAYTPAELREWAHHIEKQAWQTVFAFFKHEEAGTGPKLASQFRALMSIDEGE